MISVPDKHLLSELDKYRKETNTLFYSLSKNLITVAALFLTISPNFLGSRLQTDYAKNLFLWSVGLALVSIFAGIAQLYFDWRGFREYTEYMAAITYSSHKLNPRQQKLVIKYKELGEATHTFNTGEHWLIAQVLTVLTSFCLLFLVIKNVI